VALADAATQGAFSVFQMPSDSTGVAFTVRPVWSPGATDSSAHTVRWQFNSKVIVGADITAAGTVITFTGVSATRTVSVPVLETGASSGAVTPAAGAWVRLEIQRLGSDGNDTYVGVVNLIGVQIDYTANQ
jgi:hypothetical protein